MTRSAIRKLGQFFFILRRPLPVAIQAPAHVYYLRVDGNSRIRDIAVTAFAVQPSRNVRAVGKVDEVWHLGNWHPGDLLIVGNEVS